MGDTAELWVSCPELGPKNNSRFVHHLCRTLDNFGKEMCLSDLAKKLNDGLRNEKPLKYKKKKYQIMSRFEGSLTKSVKFVEKTLTDCSYETYELTNERDCLIIPVGKYGASMNRQNAAFDADELVRTFKRLHFKVTRTDEYITAEDAYETVNDLASQQDGRNTDMVVVCILAHGTQDKMIQFSDASLIRIPVLLRNLVNCKALQGRPKVIIVQACRGTGMADLGTTVYEPVASPDNPNFINEAEEDGIRKPSDPIEGDDVIELWSSPPGNQAFRTGDISFFIDSLCSKLNDFGETKDLEYIFQKVNEHMRDRPPINVANKSYKLASYMEHRLTKRLVFFNCRVEDRRQNLESYFPTATYSRTIVDDARNAFQRPLTRWICLKFFLLLLVLLALSCGITTVYWFVTKKKISEAKFKYEPHNVVEFYGKSGFQRDVMLHQVDGTDIYLTDGDEKYEMHSLEFLIPTDENITFFAMKVLEDETFPQERDKNDQCRLFRSIFNDPSSLVPHNECSNNGKNIIANWDKWTNLWHQSTTSQIVQVQNDNDQWLYVQIPTKRKTHIFANECTSLTKGFTPNEIVAQFGCIIPWSQVKIELYFCSQNFTEEEFNWKVGNLTAAYETANRTCQYDEHNLYSIRLTPFSDEQLLFACILTAATAAMIALFIICLMNRAYVKHRVLKTYTQNRYRSH